MEPSKVVIIYIAALVGFLVIDFIWLGVMNSRLYKPMIGHLMAETVNVLPVIIFYMAYVVGVVFLVVLPGLEAGSIWKTIGLAALLGFVAYGTYDFTNFATLKDWPVNVVLIDVVWGAFVTTMTALAGYGVGSLL